MTYALTMVLAGDAENARLIQIIKEESGVSLAFCWTHVRQRFYELAAAGPAPIACEALSIARLSG